MLFNIGVVLVIFATLGLIAAIAGRKKKKGTLGKWFGAAVVFYACAGLLFWLASSDSTQTTESAPVASQGSTNTGGNQSSSNGNGTGSQTTPTDPSKDQNQNAPLTAKDIADYDQGPYKLATDATNNVQKITDEIFTKYKAGTYNLGNVHTFSGQSMLTFNVRMNLFLNQKPAPGLVKISNEYLQELQTIQSVLTNLKTVDSPDKLEAQQEALKAAFDKKAATDKEYADIKAKVGK